MGAILLITISYLCLVLSFMAIYTKPERCVERKAGREKCGERGVRSEKCEKCGGGILNKNRMSQGHFFNH